MGKPAGLGLKSQKGIYRAFIESVGLRVGALRNRLGFRGSTMVYLYRGREADTLLILYWLRFISLRSHCLGFR